MLLVTLHVARRAQIDITTRDAMGNGGLPVLGITHDWGRREVVAPVLLEFACLVNALVAGVGQFPLAFDALHRG